MGGQGALLSMAAAQGHAKNMRLQSGKVKPERKLAQCLDNCCPIELSVMMEIFYIWAALNRSYQPHVAIEPLKYK